MNVLYVRSGNHGDDPITRNQAESLIPYGIVVLFFNISGKGFSGYLRNIFSLRRFVRKNQIELIHAHYSLSGYLSSLCFSGRPIIVSLMGSDVYDSGIFIRIILKTFIKFSWSYTIVKSEPMQKILGLKNVHILPNGVDLQKYKPVERNKALEFTGWKEEDNNILFCSDPEREEKNYPLLKEAVSLMNDESYKVFFLTGINREDVCNFYCSADVLVLTSLHEGSPNVIKEAMACNCPIVSTDVGDIREIITGTQGCYITKANPIDLSEKIRMAVNGGYKRTNGREKIGHLSSELVAIKLVKIYNSLLSDVRSN